jgi:DNA-binding NarL/FixJ family response regulator
MNFDQSDPQHSDTAEKIPVLLVDDHISIRQMLAFMLPREGPYQIVGEVSTGTEAIEKFRELQPKLVVLDLLLPEISGVEVVRLIREEGHGTRTLVYSGTSSEDLIAEAMSAKPHGFVHKEDTLQVFRDALRAVTAGGQYYTQMAAEMTERAHSSRIGALTDRERHVLQLVAEGRTNKEIAERLSMAVKTVESHRSNMCHKLDIHDVASLTRFAIRHGLVSVE